MFLPRFRSPKHSLHNQFLSYWNIQIVRLSMSSKKTKKGLSYLFNSEFFRCVPRNISVLSLAQEKKWTLDLSIFFWQPSLCILCKKRFSADWPHAFFSHSSDHPLMFLFSTRTPMDSVASPCRHCRCCYEHSHAISSEPSSRLLFPSVVHHHSPRIRWTPFCD